MNISNGENAVGIKIVAHDLYEKMKGEVWVVNMMKWAILCYIINFKVFMW